MSSSQDYSPLLLLLKATKADAVESIFVDAFRYRQDGISQEKKNSWRELLGGITENEVNTLSVAVNELIRECMYNNSAKETTGDVLGKDFHANLKGLITKIISSHLAEWREAALNTIVSPPKLIDFDWRVDMKTSSNLLSHMAVPTVFVNMKLQQVPESTGEMAGVDNVSFELSKQALATMLNGLNKIKDQLSSIQ